MVLQRFNKTVQWKIRALLFDSGLPNSMWILALETATHVYNRTLHKEINSETPLKRLTGNKNVSLDKIRRFGNLAYAKLLNTERKFSKRAIRAIMVGYSLTG